jgi:cation-transporting ATPase 13A1
LIVQGEAVIPRRGKYAGLKIFQRFHFSSALKRMSVVSGYTLPGTSETKYICTVKVTPDGESCSSSKILHQKFRKI